MLSKLEQHIQAIVFSSPNPVMITDLKIALEKSFQTLIPIEVIEEKIVEISSRFATDNFAFELKKSGGGYQFLSKSDYYESIHHFINIHSKKKLSKTALETLSIIAYKQPITKTEIELIRGVSTDYAIDKLLEKELIEIAGKKDAPGLPMMYKVTPFFMDYFGINTMEELPQLKDLEIKNEENSIGNQEE